MFFVVPNESKALLVLTLLLFLKNKLHRYKSVRSEGDWDAVSSFCEAVMLAKEEAGRVRERTSSRPSRRERHSGRRGSRDDLRPPQEKGVVCVRPCRAASGARHMGMTAVSSSVASCSASATRARKRHGRVKTGNGQDDRILSPLSCLPAGHVVTSPRPGTCFAQYHTLVRFWSCSVTQKPFLRKNSQL
uniref:SFRICE_031919 n=1 Tax=Spodoptera frugiperda TaxID=7108 RepID=A0A2H1WGL2_SPOFR